MRLVLIALFLLGCQGGPLSAAESLTPLLAAYSAGDREIVTKKLPRSMDFQRYGLADRKGLESWLGGWQPAKAALVLELIVRASEVAPAYVPLLVPIGQRYVMNRPSRPGASAEDDAFERRWHVIALAVLERRSLTPEMARYFEALEAKRPLPAAEAVRDARLVFARAIAQEQRCRAMHTAARHDRLLVEPRGMVVTPPRTRAEAIDCVRAVESLFQVAAAHPEIRAEASTRAGFALFELGRNDEAREALEAADPGSDRTLTYWRALFLGRVSDALGRDDDAERAYRLALTAFPDAQSAGVGLALALSRLHRDDAAADALHAVASRSREATDPWDTYFDGDARFLTRWLAEFREARP